MTASALYEGTIRHRRMQVRSSEFSYGLALAYLDLDELPGLLGGALVAPRPGPVRFRREDYHGDAGVPLADAVRATVAARLGSAPDGPVRMLTQLRTFGHCFNPVSFYYLFDRAGDLGALVAEVTNTPWGERKAYVLRAGPGRILRDGMAKELHVSPFMGMDQHYDVRATTPQETLSVHISSEEDGETAFDATLGMRRRALSPRSLADVSVRYPATTLRTVALIYARSLALWLRGVPVHPHPGPSRTPMEHPA